MTKHTTDTRQAAHKESNPFVTTRAKAGDKAQSAQERNRLWWEFKPMTYEPWENEDRLPKDAASFEAMEEYLLARSPYLNDRFDAAGLHSQRVLDLGCGSGVLSCYMSKHGADVIAADITDQGTQLTMQNAALRLSKLYAPTPRQWGSPTTVSTLCFRGASCITRRTQSRR